MPNEATETGQVAATPPAQTTQQPAQTATGTQTPQNQQTPPNTTQRTDAGGNNGDDVRLRGMIADLQRERVLRQQAETRLAETGANLTREQKRVLALSGIEPKSPEDAEVDQVRARLIQVFPALAKLTEEQVDKLLATAERSSGLEEVANNHWTRHAQTMLDSVAAAVADTIGTEDLTKRQREALDRAYVAECQHNPAFLKRHEMGDPKLAGEFAKAWTEDWFETARKHVVNREVERRPAVPSGRDRNIRTTPPKPVDFKNEKSVQDAMVDSFKAHGGRFDA